MSDVHIPRTVSVALPLLSYFIREGLQTVHWNLKGKQDAENLSKSAAKNKKRREAAKKKKDEEANNPANPGDKESSPAADTSTTGDPEKDKKIRKINDKLAQINKLKQWKETNILNKW